MNKVLDVFGFPEEFRNLVKVMHSNLSTRLKINGHIGEAFPHLNGVRQGCVLAPSGFSLCYVPRDPPTYDD